MKDCLFCKITKGEIPSTKIYEDENSFAFLDTTPVNPGHTLLVPKKHSRNLFDTNDETLQQLAPTLKKLSIAIKEGTKADGINIHINNEPASGQVIFHTHMHIIPRFADDNLKLWSGKKYNEGEMEEVVGKIKQQLR